MDTPNDNLNNDGGGDDDDDKYLFLVMMMLIISDFAFEGFRLLYKLAFNSRNARDHLTY